MSNNDRDDIGRDDGSDDDVIPQMNCDIELAFSGPNDATINKWAADTLRLLADRIENDGFKEAGFYPVNDKIGKNVGEIYIDFTAEVI